MRSNHFKRAILGVTAMTMLFAGTAFTNSNTMTAVNGGVVGYGTTSVTGATVSSLVYGLDATGETVTTVTLDLAGNTADSAAAIGFNGGATTACGTGTYDTTTKTTYTCTVSQSTATLASTEVVVN